MHPRTAALGLFMGATMLTMRSRIAASQPAAHVTRSELAVKMHCASCAKDVRSALESIKGVTKVDVDLEGETVVVEGECFPGDLFAALKAVGRDARLIGQSGNAPVPIEVGLEEEWGAAVGEFKGEVYGHGSVVGVVRVVQASGNQCKVSVEMEGLKPSTEYALRIHEFGDLREIPRTLGNRFAGSPSALASGVSNAEGELQSRVTVELKVWETIGRSIVLYEDNTPTLATVVARSSGVGGNSKKRLCTCDGTVIWEAKN